MTDFAYNVDAGLGTLAIGDTYNIPDLLNTPQPHYDETTTIWGRVTSKGGVEKRHSYHRFFIDVPASKEIRRVTIEVTPSISQDSEQVGNHRFGLLRRGNGALVPGLHRSSPWPAGNTGNWDMRGTSHSFIHGNVNFIQNIYTLGDAQIKILETSQGPFAGFQQIKSTVGYATFGNAFLSAGSFNLDRVRTRMFAAGAARPGVFLTMQIWGPWNTFDRRPITLLGTSDALAWDDLPTSEAAVTADDTTWPEFIWTPFSSGPDIVSGDVFVTKLTLSGGGDLPEFEGAGSGHIRVGMDMGRDINGDPTDAATNGHHAALFGIGGGGFSKQAYMRAEDFPLPTIDGDNSIQPNVVFQNQLIPVGGVTTAYAANVLLVYGEDLDDSGGIDVQVPGLVQLVQDYVDDPGYVESGAPLCIVIDMAPDPTLFEKNLFSENDPVDVGMVLRITVSDAPPSCDWFDPTGGVAFSSGELESAQDWNDGESGSPFSSAEAEQDWASPGAADWFRDRECD